MASKKNVFFVSLGCPKNLVDSEFLLNKLAENGWELSRLEEAKIVIVNTCSFIKSARRETYRELKRICDYKKRYKNSLKIFVVGCALKNVGCKRLSSMFPEVDGFVDFSNYQKILEIVSKRKKTACFYVSENSESDILFFRKNILLTPFYYSYVKIAEGCSNFCSYCSIPYIRGPAKSKDERFILDEIRFLVSKGVKEINLVAQDITNWGRDLSKQNNLVNLVKKILKIKGAYWIRLLYMHPKGITRELIDLIASEEKICPYIDMPIQHINDNILRMMNRKVKRNDIESIIEYARNKRRRIFFRTSLIVGFPGEGEKEFSELVEFVKDVKFERLGVFIYSKEKGTPAYNFENIVSSKTKKQRFDYLMSLQAEIAASVSKSLEKRKMKVLISGMAKGGDVKYWGRTWYDAPDIDPIVFVKTGSDLKVGEFINVVIEKGIGYDVLACV